MDLASAREFDDLLAELAKSDPAPGDIRMLLDEADDIARGRVAVEPQQQIRCAQMEETQRVRLRQLAHVQQLAQQFRRARDVHTQDRIAGFRAGEQMAHGTNPANARGDLRHLGEEPSLAEFLEAAELDHMEPRVGHVARVVEMDRDLRVPLDAGHGIDRNGFGVGLSHNACWPWSIWVGGPRATP